MSNFIKDSLILPSDSLSKDLLRNSDAGYAVEFVGKDKPLIITFGYFAFLGKPYFDFVNRLKKLDAILGQKTNKIFVRDMESLWYLNGVKDLGSSVDEVAVSLKGIIQEIEPSEVFTIGQSMAGYAAILYGILLDANKIISFGPVSFFDSKMALKYDQRWMGEMQKLGAKNANPSYTDLKELMTTQEKLPEIHIIYGCIGDRNADEFHAKRLQINESIKLRRYEDAGHLVVPYLADNKLMTPILSEILFQTDCEQKEFNIDVDSLSIPSNWKDWIFENLAYGCSPSELLVTLEQNGLDKKLSNHEMAIAYESPYLEAAKRLRSKVKKREWYLKTRDELEKFDPDYPKLDVLEEVPSFEEFKNIYISKNRPALLKGAVSHWKAMDWTLEGLIERVGDAEVKIQDGRESNENYETDKDQHQKDMKMSDFLNRVIKSKKTNDFYMTTYNASHVTEKIYSLVDDYDNIGDGYLDMSKDEILKNSSIWIGPEGTKTPLHCDLINNFVTQIMGRKKFWLIPPYQTPYLYDANYVFSAVKNIEDCDYEAFPDMRNVTPIEVIIEPGDVLFIPLAWYHNVHSLSASITHTFLNIKDLKNEFSDYG